MYARSSTGHLVPSYMLGHNNMPLTLNTYDRPNGLFTTP